MKYLFFTFLLIISFMSIGQKSEMDIIKNQWETILGASDVEEKLQRNDKFERYVGSIKLLKSDYQKNGISAEPDLNQLEQFSDMWSKDSTLRISSWFFALDEENFQYNLQFEIVRPIKSSDRIDLMYTSMGSCYNAIGKDCGRNQFKSCNKDSLIFLNEGYFYYDLIETKGKFDTYYTLIGWSKEGLTSQKKIMNSFRIKEKDSSLCILPAKIIETEEGAPTNFRTFEYSAQTTMKLKYVEQQNWIIMDHLSPPTSQYKGVYEYYGPDFSFDAYVWKDDRWKLEEDVDVEKGVKKKSSEFDVEDQILEKEEIYSPK